MARVRIRPGTAAAAEVAPRYDAVRAAIARAIGAASPPAEPPRGRAAAPRMTPAARAGHYLTQTGRAQLTPAQARRVARKARAGAGQRDGAVADAVAAARSSGLAPPPPGRAPEGRD